MTTLLTLFLHIFLVSFLSFGGVQGVLPELYRQIVEIDQWMSAQVFRDYFAIAQASPGPNFLIVTLIGWHVGGLVGMPIIGAIIGTIALTGTTSTLMYWGYKYLNNLNGHIVKDLIETAAGPVAVGLVLASSWRLSLDINQNWQSKVLTGIALIIVLRFKLHPLWLILCGAIFGYFFLG